MNPQSHSSTYGFSQQNEYLPSQGACSWTTVFVSGLNRTCASPSEST